LAAKPQNIEGYGGTPPILLIFEPGPSSRSSKRHCRLAADAAGAVGLLYPQGGVPALVATSSMVEKETRATPEFSNGLVVGFAVAAVFPFGMQKRST
jgi:hypothetical protein